MPLQITILGMNAIGASLGLAFGTLDPKRLDVGRPVITGWDRDKRTLSDARGRLAADRIQHDLVAAVSDADVVVVSVPYAEVREVLAAIAPALKPGAVVTDTLATKAQVLEWAGTLLPLSVEFVGGHPLASVGGSGVRDASSDALRDCIYCLVPLPRTRRSALDGIEALVTAIGAKPYYVDAAEHDSYVAAAGHLPVAVAVALMETVSRTGGWREIRPIAGQALLGMTDLLSGDVETPHDALASNAVALQGWLDRMIQMLVDLRGRLDNPAALRETLEHAREARTAWLRSEPNLRPGEESLRGNVENVEGMGIGSLFFGRRAPRGPDRRR